MPIGSLALLVTYKCNIECKHCGLSCSPRETDWISQAEIKDLINQAAHMGGKSVVLTGGEPTLLGDEVLCDILRFAKVRDMDCRIVTNGWWAKTPESAHLHLKAWQDAGLDELNVSCGVYHQEFVPIENVANAYRTAQALNYRTVLLAGEFLHPKAGARPLPEDYFKIIGENLIDPSDASPFSCKRYGMTVNGVMPAGRGADYINPEQVITRDILNDETISTQCTDLLSSLSIHPDGKVTACCGVITRQNSVLELGDWRTSRLIDIYSEMEDDLIFNWIRYLGLRNLTKWLSEKVPNLELPARQGSLCDLCCNLLSREDCVEALLQHGSQNAKEINRARHILEQSGVSAI